MTTAGAYDLEPFYRSALIALTAFEATGARRPLFGTKAEVTRELAYRLYTLCERKKRANEALAYNGIVQSWPEIVRVAKESAKPAQREQADLFASKGGK